MAVGVLKAWSTTAATNASADSNVSYAEGQTPASLNDAARAAMASIKGFANQITGAKTSGGSANAQTFTSDTVAAISTAYAAGMIFCVKAGFTNSTTTPTFNVDGVGAKTIKKGGDQAALAASDIVAGGIYWLAYEASGDCFLLLNPESGPVSAQPLDATLTALAALSYTSGTLIPTMTAADTFALVSDALYAHLAGTETFSGAKTFTAAPIVNLNASGTPAGVTGAVVRIIGTDASAATIIQFDSLAGNAGMMCRRANGTAASPSALTSGDVIAVHSARGYGATGYSTTSRGDIRILAAEGWTDSAHGTRGSLFSTSLLSTTNTERYRWGDTTSTLELGYRDGGPGSVPDATYTYALTDRGTPTDHSSGSAHTYTVPPASSVVWPANSILMGCNTGAGTLTIGRGSGVVLRNAAGTDADLSVPQYGYYVLRRVASDVWYGRTY